MLLWTAVFSFCVLLDVRITVPENAHSCWTSFWAAGQDKAMLSQGLHTPPLPVEHALVGYWLQKTKLLPIDSVITATHATLRFASKKVYFRECKLLPDSLAIGKALSALFSL